MKVSVIMTDGNSPQRTLIMTDGLPETAPHGIVVPGGTIMTPGAISTVSIYVENIRQIVLQRVLKESGGRIGTVPSIR